jgi:hypothetical protein
MEVLEDILPIWYAQEESEIQTDARRMFLIFISKNYS